jgi:hypothetical protein
MRSVFSRGQPRPLSSGYGEGRLSLARTCHCRRESVGVFVFTCFSSQKSKLSDVPRHFLVCFLHPLPNCVSMIRSINYLVCFLLTTGSVDAGDSIVNIRCLVAVGGCSSSATPQRARENREDMAQLSAAGPANARANSLLVR